MKVCILAVCHNSYRESLRFLDTIAKSINNSEVDLVFFFIDNSSRVDTDLVELVKSYSLKFRLNYIRSENLGYFPSITSAINKHAITLTDYDYVMISNVDLLISKNFFSILESIPVSRSVGVYAPSIYSSALGVDRNPKINKRPSAFKLKLNRHLYKYSFSYFLLRLMNMLRLNIMQILKSTFKTPSVYKMMDPISIYAAHGSFIILTNEFVKKNDKISYPVFLFCEEIYVAEKSREYGLKVVYYPDLLVYDSEHASTSLMKSEDYRNFNVEALSYVLKNYKFYK